MSVTLAFVIAEIGQLDDPTRRKLSLPDAALIRRYEAATGFTFSADYRLFLMTVSNAFVGTLDPLILSDAMGGTHGEMLTTLQEARAAGIPPDWLPICADNGDYYCLTPAGTVRFWSHNGSTSEAWPDLATWAWEVWVSGN
ncbi:MAG: hypothetical protein CFE34_04580 [Rhodobacteraceae bacterium PARR1]|nr:MAG: hypothetical protein CFE34_04580 [Rhodobacteraceae bacterium PARR1]